MAGEIVQSLITPNALTINRVFSEKERYYIDIYQRDYKWQKSQVETLLRDIELRFNLSQRNVSDPKNIKKDVLENYKPYFLNTYLTCKTTTFISIVDGQQRLTTFLIMLIALRRIVSEVHENASYTVKTVSVSTLEKLIFEADDFSKPEYYKIYNPNRQGAFDYILGNITEYEAKDETQKKILENYVIISTYFNSLFKSEESGLTIDVKKLTYYIYYILEKLNIVEIHIEQQENVATIFEVVNDRGLGLKPYEILKGKFLGNLYNEEKEKANEIWVELQNKYYNSIIKNSTENEIDLDTFFKIYLRAKFAETENDYKKFEDKYHYEIYQNQTILSFFNRFEDTKKLYNWVVNDFRYFAELHLKIRTTYENEYLVFNKLLDQNQQYLLIISAIELNDKQANEKINLVAKKFDQMHSTVRLLDLYDSNSFQDFVYKLMPKVRNKSLNEIAKAFDDVLIAHLEEEEIITKGAYTTIGDLYKPELFQNIHNRWLNFTKYTLMRIDKFLGEKLDKPSYCKDALTDLEERFNKNNKKVYGMHLEHIYANNDRNKKLFTDKDGFFDESKFNTVRNKLGMLLLLKDKQNISSNNDYYSLKVEDYKTSNLIWNELLVGHIDSIDRKHLPSHINFTKIEPNQDGVFPLEMLETRQKETFEMLKQIWGF
ncbi:DUF262 domain-containing protein [Aurantibacillus circumpalustris]|uniref:DUF262 domain-containing protein n=1 Tax=Aurantibacillus circumpalustris TaxID=3036359 RepID=UPI00295ABEA5|nr:DUF262 domain-containing protein [Aurantibacillus circumpalustris]